MDNVFVVTHIWEGVAFVTLLTLIYVGSCLTAYHQGVMDTEARNKKQKEEASR